jgi:hypothetical protein
MHIVNPSACAFVSWNVKSLVKNCALTGVLKKVGVCRLG